MRDKSRDSISDAAQRRSVGLRKCTRAADRDQMHQRSFWCHRFSKLALEVLARITPRKRDAGFPVRAARANSYRTKTWVTPTSRPRGAAALPRGLQGVSGNKKTAPCSTFTRGQLPLACFQITIWQHGFRHSVSVR